MDPIAFRTKWRTASVNLKERTASQSHFNDLCALVGVQNPIEADPIGDTYTFEKGAGKAGGGDGWADVWYRGRFAWEYKGYGRDLDAAYLQLLRYKDALENPPLLVVCDLDRIEIRTNFTNSVQRTEVITLDDIADPGKLAILKRVWTEPDWFRPDLHPDDVTKEAASRFGEIARGLHSRGIEPARAAHALMQLLFCLFAEDIGLLPQRIFSRMLDMGMRYPARFQAETTRLLEAMNTGDFVAYEKIPHINGGLFRHVDVPELDEAEIRILREAATLDWSSIEPAIFGTLFERSLDPAKRSQLGAHYTGRPDIERVVDPVVMTPLRRRWDEVRAQAEALLDPPRHSERTRRIPVRSTSNASRSDTRRRNAFNATIDAFLAELRGVRVLDPACGSGNFLYVALDRLLTLEREVNTYRATSGLGFPMGYPQVRPEQMLGLEINEYAQELAQVAIWIGYIQWMVKNGFGWSEPVLGTLDTIRLQDALLTFHEDGTVTETEWPEADFIIGNPPFLGRQVQRRQLGDSYTESLREVYGSRLVRGCDLVCYFFEQARQQIERGLTRRAGLLANTTINQVGNREVLARIAHTGGIFMAWRNVRWVLEGASVRIAAIGFDDGTEITRQVDGSVVSNIGPDLESAPSALEPHRLVENRNISFQGPIKVGPFDVDGKLAVEWLEMPLNPNGNPNHDVVRRYVNGSELVGRPRDKWVVDFGVGMSLEDAALYEAPFQYVRQNVYPVRIKNKDRGFRERWWIHGRPRVDMRIAMQGLDRFIATPAVTKHRIFRWVPISVYPDHRLCVFAREDDYFFGVLHSRAHEVWSLRTSSRHGVGNDPTYNNTTCFETFPLPWPPGQEPVDDPRVIAIGEAAKRLNELRENWLNPEGATEAELKKRTLTNLYNQRPTWLQHAHASLDRAVWDAYGWPADEVPADVEEDVILSRLLALNGERAGA